MDREKIGFYVDIVMIILAIFTVFLLFYEMTIAPADVTPADISAGNIPEEVKAVLPKIVLIHKLDLWICIVFIVEFLVRIVKEPDRKAFFKAYWLEIPGMIPFTLPFLNISKTFRVFRLFRLVRLFSMMKRLSRLYQKRFVRNELQYTALIVIMILLFSAYGIFFFERQVNPDINSAGDALWWSIVTVTTVGYGDKVPITPLGKVLGVILMVTGIGVIGVLSGTIASRLLRGYRTEREAGDVQEALRILKLRRAKGEVTEEQYHEIKKDLEEMQGETG
ncbi:MAG: ion transporter [Theionarchaea archaeon]|nr:ion transporter [Theionarchaea archaeon]